MIIIYTEFVAVTFAFGFSEEVIEVMFKILNSKKHIGLLDFSQKDLSLREIV